MKMIKIIKIMVLMVALYTINCVFFSEQQYTAHTEKVMVNPGETLWQIAERYAPLDEKYKTMDEYICGIAEQNDGKKAFKAGDIINVVYYKEKK